VVLFNLEEEGKMRTAEAFVKEMGTRGRTAEQIRGVASCTFHASHMGEIMEWCDRVDLKKLAKKGAKQKLENRLHGVVRTRKSKSKRRLVIRKVKKNQKILVKQSIDIDNMA